ARTCCCSQAQSRSMSESSGVMLFDLIRSVCLLGGPVDQCGDPAIDGDNLELKNNGARRRVEGSREGSQQTGHTGSFSVPVEQGMKSLSLSWREDHIEQLGLGGRRLKDGSRGRHQLNGVLGRSVMSPPEAEAESSFMTRGENLWPSLVHKPHPLGCF